MSLQQEVFYRTSRSGGKGGQNVNKVETAAEAWWHVDSSRLYSEQEKSRITDKLRNRINKEGYLLVKSSETRSQLENKQLALKKMQELILQNIFMHKSRRPTRPSRSAIERRLGEKRKAADKKEQRRQDW